jgi:hypothetical protein
MKIALIVLAVLVATALVITFIGSRLPVAHTASRSALIAQAPADVYAEVRKRTAADKAYEIVEDLPPVRLVTRIADKNLPYGGSWTFELAPEGTGTRVTITENGEVYNPLFRFLSRFVFGHTATMDEYLASLSAPKE